jgi:hypothetical protein
MNMHEALWFIDQLTRFHGRAFTRTCLRGNFQSNRNIFGTGEHDVARDWDQLEAVISKLRKEGCVTPAFKGRLRTTPRGEEVLQFLDRHCPVHRFPENGPRRVSECILRVFSAWPQFKLECACLGVTKARSIEAEVSRFA